MFAKNALPVIAIVLGFSANCGIASAQSGSGLSDYNNVFARRSSMAAGNYSSTMDSGRVPSTFGAGSAGLRSKPFSSYSSQPAVSPYLNLFRNDLNGQSDFNYSLLVQPQLQQQQINDAQQRAAAQNARKLQQIAAQPQLNPQGSKDEAPTGHQTVYKYTSHYFPTPKSRPKRQASQQQ